MQYRNITAMYCRHLHAVILVYDVSDRSSFEGMAYWGSFAKQHSKSNIFLVLVGYKTDSQRSVSYCEGAHLAEKMKVLFVETSDTKESNVEQVFYLVGLMQARLKA